MYPTSTLKSVRQYQQEMSSWLEIHIHLNPNLIYTGYKCMLLIWKCGALDQNLFHSLWPPTKKLFVKTRSGFPGGRMEGCTPNCLYTVSNLGSCGWAFQRAAWGGLCTWAFLLPKTAKERPSFYSASWRWIWGLSFCRDPAWGEALGGVSPKGSVLLPRCAGGRWSGAVSTALRRAFRAMSRITVTTSSAIMFGFLVVRKFFLPCPPRLLVLVYLRGYKIYFRLTFNSTSAPLSLSSSQNMMALASLPLNTHVTPVPKASPQWFQCRHCSRDIQWRIDFCWPLSYLTSFSRFSETMKGMCYTQSNLKQYSCLIFKGRKWKYNISSPAIASEGRDHVMALTRT